MRDEQVQEFIRTEYVNCLVDTVAAFGVEDISGNQLHGYTAKLTELAEKT